MEPFVLLFLKEIYIHFDVVLPSTYSQHLAYNLQPTVLTR